MKQLIGNMKMKTKLLSLVAIFAISFIGYGLYAFSAMEKVEIGGPLYKQIVQGKDLIADILPPPEYILESYLTAFQMTYSTNNEEKTALIEKIATLKKDYETRHEFWKTDLEDGTMKTELLDASYKPAMEFYSIVEKELIPSVKNANTSESIVVLEKLHPLFNKHLDAINNVVRMSTEKNTEVEKTANATVKQAVMTLVGSVIIILALVSFASIFMTRQISFGIHSMLTALEKLAQGDFNQKVNLDTKDELGEMGKALNTTITTLQHKVETIRSSMTKAASGDLTAKVALTGQDPMGQIGESVNHLLNNLRVSLSNVGQNVSTLGMTSQGLLTDSNKMSDSFAEASVQSNSVATASEQIDGNIQVIASSMEEMGATVKEIAKNTSEASKLTASAVNTLSNADATISQLGKSSNEIGEVIKVITSIAEQTNLLALNATIEAARAGEAGKGFAVVANEVKELAKQTATATEEISQKIAMIKSSSEAAVLSVVEIRDVISKVNDITSVIASAVEEQTVTTNEISRNMSGAAAGSTEIVQNMKGIAETNNMATKGAEGNKKVANELNDLSSQLKTLIGNFKLSESGNSDKIAWTKDLATGDDEIDRQHQELFGRIDGLNSALISKNMNEVEKSFSFLEDYVATHFGYEQNEMKKLGYPEMQAHLAQHEYYVKKFHDIRDECRKTGVDSAIVIQIKRHLIDWLINHIKTTDVKLGAFLSANGSSAHV